MRSSFFLPFALGLAPILVAYGCYGATAVTVTLTTDLPCSATLATNVYKGAPESLDTNPSVTTKLCTEAGDAAAGLENTIGSITLVPSDSRSAQFEVKAVLAQNGKDPALCAADISDCIVSTRIVSFAEHETQDVRMSLLQDCLGVSCPAGQTCIAGGLCSSNQPGLRDAGSDAAVDGGSGGGGGGGGGTGDACGARGQGGILVTASAVPGARLSALVKLGDGSPSRIYWAQGRSLFYVTVDGKQTSPADGQKLTSDPVLAVVDSHRGDVGIVSSSDSSSTVVVRGETRRAQNLPAGARALAFDGNGGVVAVGYASNILALVFPGGSPVAVSSTFGADVMVSRNATAYAAGSTGTWALPISPSAANVPRQVGLFPMGKVPVALAAGPDRVFGAGATLAGGTRYELRDADDAQNSSTLDAGSPVLAVAVDAANVYWLQGRTVRARPLDRPADAPVVVFDESDTSQTLAHLTVDDECLYLWEKGSGDAVLRAISKAK